MFEKYTGNNFAQGLILGGLASDGVILTLQTGQGALFPTTFPFLLVIEKYNEAGLVTRREIVKCTNRVGDNLTIVRAFEGCPVDYQATTQSQTPFAFDNGDQVSLCFTAGDHKDIQDEVSRLETDKLNKSTYYAEQEVFSATVTGNDAYRIISTTVTTYNNGQTFKVQADVGNDGACTLELNSLGSKFIKKYVSGALVNLETGDISASQIFWATYNSLADCFQFSVDPATAPIVSVNATESTFTAGENITAGDALRSGFLGNTGNFNQSIKNAEYNLGASGNSNKIGQVFTSNAGENTISAITAFLRINAGTPTDGIICKVFASDKTTLLGTSTNTILASSMTATSTQFTFNFANISITPGATLFIEFSRTGTLSDVNFYTIGVSNTSVIAGSLWSYLSTTWTEQTTYDVSFTVQYYSNEDTSKIYKTNASVEKKINFIGFAKETVLLNEVIKVRSSGIAGNLSGLTIGSDYFLTNTAGVISTTPGTNVVSVGKAVSTTSIEISVDRVKQLGVITPTVGASPFTYQNTTGRPIILSITGGTVSAVAFSRDNTNFFQTASATNTILTLGVNDYCRVTYTVAPVLKVFTL